MPIGVLTPVGEHVDPVLDRHRPDVRPARHLDRRVQLAAEPDQLVAIDLPEEEPIGRMRRESSSWIASRIGCGSSSGAEADGCRE